MKRANSILVVLMSFSVMVGCIKGKQSANEEGELITVDVTKRYTIKKELILQDFMDVEYVQLETNNDFLNQGHVHAIGEEIILVGNRNFNDGDIFVYDRSGKALKKINRKGQSREEYLVFSHITLDEDNGEMFVNAPLNRCIFVYDLNGNFIRRFKYKEGGGSLFYTAIFNYDKENLICYDNFNDEIPFILVSKKDGSITKEITIPFKEKIFLQQKLNDGENTLSVSSRPYRTIIPFKGDWKLLEISSDTIFTFLPNYNLRPFIVRNPAVQSMDPAICLTISFMSDRYFFMETIKNVYDWNNSTGFPKTFFMYDRQNKAFSEYTVYNGDYSTKKEIYFSDLRPVNHKIESWMPLEAYQLVEEYKKGILKGELKEIASRLDKEDNPVIMLVKHKN